MPTRDALDRVRLAAPCPAKWEDMTGDDRVRRCARCALNVYDVAALPRAEALALIEDHEARDERLCLKLWRRGDGRVISADCPKPAARRMLRAACVAFLATAALVAATQAGTGERLPNTSWFVRAADAWLERAFPDAFGPEPAFGYALF